MFSSSKAQRAIESYWGGRRGDSLMLAIVRDDTWNVLNMQHKIPNSKRWDYSDIPGGGNYPNQGWPITFSVGRHIWRHQAPVPLTIFRSNSKFDQNLQCSLPITTKFCTSHDSYSDLLSIFYRSQCSEIDKRRRATCTVSVDKLYWYQRAKFTKIYILSIMD